MQNYAHGKSDFSITLKLKNAVIPEYIHEYSIAQFFERLVLKFEA